MIKYQLKFPQKIAGEEEGDWEWEYYEDEEASKEEEEEPVVEEKKEKEVDPDALWILKGKKQFMLTSMVIIS